MMNDATSVVVAFPVGWLCHAILLRLGNPVRRHWRRRPANSRPVQLRRPTLPTVSPWGLGQPEQQLLPRPERCSGCGPSWQQHPRYVRRQGGAAVEVSADRPGWREAMGKQQCWDRLSMSKPRPCKPQHANRSPATGKSSLETLDSVQTMLGKGRGNPSPSRTTLGKAKAAK
jgi:hypothetical protein